MMNQKNKALGIGVGMLTILACTPALAEVSTAPVGAGSSGIAQSKRVVNFDVPSERLEDAMVTFASQSNLGLFIRDDALRSRHGHAVKGRYSVEDALQSLLAGTGVGFQIIERDGGSQVLLFDMAQTSAESAISLAPLVVKGVSSGQGQGDWVYQEPRSVSVITREQLDRRPARHAADMLEQTSGVYSSVSQQDPSLSVNIRGIQDFGRVNMNVDGVRQNYQKTGYGQRNGQMYIDPELLSGVTIDKGAANVMGSAGTLGGVATFSTVNASDFINQDKEFGGKLSVGGGNNGTNFIGSGVFAAGNETVDILLGLSRRSFGDYRSGSNGDIGNWSRVEVGNGLVDGYEKVFADALKGGKISLSGYRMESQLAKFGWNLPNNQRLQLGYMHTETDTANAGVLVSFSNSANALEQRLGWKNSSDSNIAAQHVTLDYSIRPDEQDWLDLQLKFYYADTENKTTHHGSPARYDVWPIQYAVAGYDDHTRLKTYGFQAQNTSRLWQLDTHDLVADYGAEIYHDEAISSSTDPNSLAAGTTPEGKRTMASIFANFNYSHADWLVLEGGLRYDRYRLQGNASLGIQKLNYTEEAPCTEHRLGACQNFFSDETLHWDIDDEQYKISPTLFVGIKPGLDWLQLFGSYGKSWRPPAVTETFASGTARAGDYYLYPNPQLDAERSKSWELGFNILKAGLFTEEDQLAVKVAYFNTSVDGYISMVADQKPPGNGQRRIGNTVFQNNLKDSRFRGVEYLLSYDAGFAYGVANFTQMLGRNEYCYPYAWLGGATTIAGSRGNWYGAPAEAANLGSVCTNDALFSSSAFLPGARGSVTLGARAFSRKLDMGVTMRFAPGYQDKSISSNTPYQADWPKYQIYDLYASYPVTKDLMLRASVENVADEVYLVSYGEFMGYTPSRGRTAQASLEYRF